MDCVMFVLGSGPIRAIEYCVGHESKPGSKQLLYRKKF